MPTYEYKCKSCNIVFEKILRIADRENPIKEECPECKSINSVERYISASTDVAWSDSYTLGRIKPPQDWQNFVSALKKQNPNKHTRDF